MHYVPLCHSMHYVPLPNQTPPHRCHLSTHQVCPSIAVCAKTIHVPHVPMTGHARPSPVNSRSLPIPHSSILLHLQCMQAVPGTPAQSPDINFPSACLATLQHAVAAALQSPASHMSAACKHEHQWDSLVHAVLSNSLEQANLAVLMSCAATVHVCNECICMCCRRKRRWPCSQIPAQRGMP